MGAGAYRYDPKTATLPGAAGGVLALALAATAAVESGTMQVAFAALSALSVVGLLGVLPLVVDRRVQLSVDAHGLTYRPFSPQPIPWDDITAIAIVRTTHKLGPLIGFLWKETLLRESVNFDVLDPARHARGLPLYRLSARLAAQGAIPAYPVEVGYLRDANAAALVREIKRYWRGPVETFERTRPPP